MEMEHQPEDFDMGTVEQSQDASLQTDDVQGVEQPQDTFEQTDFVEGVVTKRRGTMKEFVEEVREIFKNTPTETYGLKFLLNKRTDEICGAEVRVWNAETLLDIRQVIADAYSKGLQFIEGYAVNEDKTFLFPYEDVSTPNSANEDLSGQDQASLSRHD